MNILIYSKNNCPYCETAINAAFNLKAVVTVKKIDESSENYTELLTEVPGARTVPQVFVEGQYIGGSDKFLAWIKATDGGTKVLV
jgi:glutaredoxin